MKNEYPQPLPFNVPTKEDAERIAKFINSKLTNKKVTSISGIPMDENGNVALMNTAFKYDGSNLNDVLERSGNWNAMLVHQINIKDVDSIEKLKKNIQNAYVDSRVAAPRSKIVKEFNRQKEVLLNAIDKGLITQDQKTEQSVILTRVGGVDLTAKQQNDLKNGKTIAIDNVHGRDGTITPRAKVSFNKDTGKTKVVAEKVRYGAAQRRQDTPSKSIGIK